MDVRSLAKEFIENSPDFHKDLDLPNIDKKHIGILTKSYEEEAEGNAFSENSFRNWKGQSDMGGPPQIIFAGLFSKHGMYNLLKYFYYLI